ncbi:MAG: response regulator transcription factor [Bacteroidetes bacterium]|nr:response regulator transcription factor [Bacteroidota bacterium]
MTPKILIADDHSLIRKGLKLNLQLSLGYTDITEVATCSDLMKALRLHDFTHIILDIILADGSTLEVIPNITSLYPKISILVFSMLPEAIYGTALEQYGIRFFLPKSVDDDEMNHVLRQFLENDFSALPHGQHYKTNPFSNLSPRELEILHYMLRGVGTKDIAETLNLKMNTVSTLKSRIMFKTKVSNTKELLELAALYNLSY